MDNTRIERATIDGRRTEIHTQEQLIDGATQRIIEHYEEIVPFEKKKQIIEKIMPIVMERVIEQYDGNQTNRTIEHVEDTMELKASINQLTATDIEAIVRKVIGNNIVVNPVVPVQPTQTFWNKFFGNKSTPASSNNDNPVISYILITLLATQVGFMAWQLFIR